MKLNGLGHIAIECKDLDKTLEFYCGLLGFERVTDNACDKGDGANYFIKNGSVTIELLMCPDRDVRGWGVINHVALAVDDVIACRRELTAKGVQFETDDICFDPALYGRGEYFVIFSGPNGERLQLEQVL